MIEFLRGAEVIIHNAAFDVPFINWELGLLRNNKYGTLEQNVARIVDSLDLARKNIHYKKIILMLYVKDIKLGMIIVPFTEHY